VHQLAQLAPRNKVIVAIANKAGVIAGRAVQLPGLLRRAWKAQPAFRFSTATTTAKTAREVEPSNAGNLKQLGHTGAIMKPMAAGILFVGVSSHASRRSDQVGEVHRLSETKTSLTAP